MPQPGVIYEFCLGRGSQYPLAFLGGTTGPPYAMLAQPPWHGTLVCDQYAGYDRALDVRVFPQRRAAGCVVHYLERRFIWGCRSHMQVRCDARAGAVPDKAGHVKGTARTRAGPPSVSRAWPVTARSLRASRRTASHRASSAGSS